MGMGIMIEPFMPLLADMQKDWAVVAILALVACGFAIGNVVASALIGPSRKGKVKDSVYESGVDPIGSTRQRFNVRFYLVAMIFLVFDVEILFFIPWVTIFPNTTALGMPTSMIPVLFGCVLTFTTIVLVAYIYAWGKGVFKWD